MTDAGRFAKGTPERGDMTEAIRRGELGDTRDALRQLAKALDARDLLIAQCRVDLAKAEAELAAARGVVEAARRTTSKPAIVEAIRVFDAAREGGK